MNGPIGIAVTPANEIMVEDSLNRRLSYFARDGKFLRARSTAQGMGMGLAGLVMDKRGRMVGRSLFMDGGRLGFEVRTYDPNLKPGAALARIEMGGLGKLRIDPLTSAPGLVLSPDERGRIFLGSSEGYRIRVFDFEGRLLRIVEREYDPVPVAKEDHDRIFKILGGMPATGGLNLKEMITIPEAYPAYLMFIVDPDGRILVRTFEKGKAEKEFFYDLFDARGRYVHRFASRTEFVLWNGRLYRRGGGCGRFRDLEMFPGHRLGGLGRTVGAGIPAFGHDGDPALALEVDVVHHPFLDAFIVAEGAALAQERVHEGRLAVVNVGDDGDVAKVCSCYHFFYPFLGPGGERC